MLHAVLARLTYANVVSTTCLFIVLGGTSYAVATGSGTLVGADLSGSERVRAREPPGAAGTTGSAGRRGHQRS
jgi:hypothetical protein